jgi:hypothetical protein
VVLYDLWLVSFKECVFPQMFFTLNIIFYFFIFWFGMCVEYLSISNLLSVGNSNVEYTLYVSPIATCSKEKENIDE